MAYIYLADGTFLNAEIIKQGYGFAYTRFPFQYMDKFRKYQMEAIENESGLWEKIIYDPMVSNLIMHYENMDEKGEKLFKEFLEFLIPKYKKERRNVNIIAFCLLYCVYNLSL